MPRTAVIMQPTYLPWIGYFDLLDQADVFVFLDDAQLSRKSWHHRNRIRTPKGLEWLTVPVRGQSLVAIRDAKIPHDAAFGRKHMRAIEGNYRSAPYFDAYFPELCEILAESHESVAALNVRLITWLAKRMGITTTFEVSSALGARGRRSELMVDICRRVGAQICLSPAGSAAYLAAEYDPSRVSDLELLFHHYCHPIYRQLFDPFVPFASTIDLLLNEGHRALEVIRSGRRTSVSASEAFIGSSEGHSSSERQPPG